VRKFCIFGAVEAGNSAKCRNFVRGSEKEH
jgi:hypothetical protein